MSNHILEEYIIDLKDLALVLDENKCVRFNEEEEEQSFDKEIDKETVMNDCDASDCKFWNEGFRGNCKLTSIEIDPKHGCMQFRPKGKGNEA